MTENAVNVSHIKQHKKLHTALDMLVADFMLETKRLASDTTVLELMQWSAQQCQVPHNHKGK